MQFLDVNELLSEHQHGFRTGRLQLLEVLDTWTSMIDEEGGVDVAYLDFSKGLRLSSPSTSFEEAQSAWYWWQLAKVD